MSSLKTLVNSSQDNLFQVLRQISGDKLRDAVEANDVEFLRSAFTFNVDPDIPDVYGCRALVTACQKRNNDEVVQTLINGKASVNLRWRGITPVYIAVVHKNMGAVSILAASNADLCAYNKTGTILHSLCELSNDRWEMASLLLQSGAEPCLFMRNYTRFYPAVYARSLNKPQLAALYEKTEAVFKDSLLKAISTCVPVRVLAHLVFRYMFDQMADSQPVKANKRKKIRWPSLQVKLPIL